MNIKITRSFITILAASIAFPAFSQQLEEVIVTARKRAENLQDVSVSVSHLGGEFMADASLNRVEDFSAYIPNLTFSETAIGTNIYIRGIGSGINQGFEQSVGMYVDGIYYGRAQLTRAPIFDMEAVEVLRGPQVTLFGNNSVGGAIVQRTARPTQEFEASVSALYEPNHDEKEAIFTVSGPLTDWMAARFSYRHYDLGGYMDNKTLDQDEPERKYRTARAIVDFTPTDQLDFGLKLERSTFDTTGRGLRVFQARPSVGFGASAQSYANFNDVQGMTLGEILSGFPSVGGAKVVDADDEDSRFANGDLSDNTTRNATFNLNYQLASGGVFTAILGYMDYEYNEDCDCDFTGAEIVPLKSTEKYDQRSAEFRFASSVGESIDYIIGGYYQQDSLEFNDALFALPDPSGLYDLLLGIPLVAGAAPLITDRSTPRDFDQDATNKAIFGQVTWSVTDNFRSRLGLRRSVVKKKGSRSLEWANTDGSPVEPGFAETALDIAYSILFSAYRHDLEGSRTEWRTGWNLTFEYDFNDSMMGYLSYKNGFKPGGYDARSNAPPDIADAQGTVLTFSPGSFEYEDEEVSAYELGAKLTITPSIELNVAAFYTAVKNMQVSVFDGALGFNVSNAAAATSTGLEMDGRWAISDEWMLVGSIGWLNFEFDDYADGLCTSTQQLKAAATGIGANGDAVAQGTQCVADFTGKTNQYVADFSGRLSLMYDKPIGRALLFRSSFDIFFTDDYSPAQNLDPDLQQNAYQTYNLRFGIGDIDGSWEVAVLGKNLTDERVVQYANDVPLSTSQFGARSAYGFYNRPRSIALQAKYNFF